MNNNTPPSPDELYQKVVRGEHLTQAESEALMSATGVWIEPTAPDPVNSTPELSTNAINEARGEIREATEGALEENGSRCFDVTDLVTGERVVNIYPRKVFNQFTQKLTRDIQRLHYRPARVKVDIQKLMTKIDRYLLPGFNEAFSPAEIARFPRADAELRERVTREVDRMIRGSIVEDMLRGYGNAITTEIKPYIAKITNVEMRKSIEQSVSAWEKNMPNPYRNAHYRTNRLSKKDPFVQREYALPLLERNAFSVALLDDEKCSGSIFAGYDPLSRMLYLTESPTDRYDAMHALYVLHELTHVSQHEKYVERARTHEERAELHKRYTGSLDEVKGLKSSEHGILEDECEAFAATIELIIARIGFGNHGIYQVMQLLGLDTSDEIMAVKIDQLLKLAELYYKGGGRKGDVYPQEYVHAIRKRYSREGLTLHRYGPDGRIIRDI